MVVAGFQPSPLGKVTQYWPTWTEFFISMGVYGIGAFLVTVFYKMTLSLRGETGENEKKKEIAEEVETVAG